MVRWAAAAMSLGAAAGVAGCGGGASASAQPTGALAVVVGAHSNMPSAVLVGRAASARDMAARQQSEFSLTVADGAPFREDVGIGLAQGSDREGIDEAIAQARARTPETDLLGAIAVAADELADRRGLRTLLVLDSGLSTAGPVNFSTPGLLDVHPQELADALSDALQLPDLSGVRVIFQGIGQTAAPQQALDPVRRSQLAAIWTAIARQAGASSVQVEEGSVDGAESAGLPPVSTVDPGSGHTCTGATMTLTGGPFGFRPDSDQFVDAQAVVTALRGIADQLRSGQVVATVFGTTASIGEVSDRVRFSNERAQAVADVLIELGVPIPQLRVEGLGSDFAGYVRDHDDAGRLLPAAAALNRTVFLQFDGPIECP